MYVGKVVFLQMLKAEKGKGKGGVTFLRRYRRGRGGRKEKEGGFALLRFCSVGRRESTGRESFRLPPPLLPGGEGESGEEGGGDLSERCLASTRVFFALFLPLLVFFFVANCAEDLGEEKDSSFPPVFMGTLPLFRPLGSEIFVGQKSRRASWHDIKVLSPTLSLLSLSYFFI